MPNPIDEYLDPLKKPVIPRFRTEPFKVEFASQQAGRPIYEDREYVEIMVIGARGATANELVTEEHKKRWPVEYAAFKAGREAPLEGTPLSEWASSKITRARVEELAYFNIRTVEDLASVNDGALQNLGMGARELRETARKFLDVARNGTGPLERLVAENVRLRDEVLRLTEDLTAANAVANALREQLKERANASA